MPLRKVSWLSADTHRTAVYSLPVTIGIFQRRLRLANAAQSRDRLGKDSGLLGGKRLMEVFQHGFPPGKGRANA